MSFPNDKKKKFLDAIPEKSCSHANSEHAKYSKFCFAYFTTQAAGQDFCDWDHQKLIKLFHQLRDYCKEPLKHWEQQPIGRGNGRVLSIYGSFPSRSEFTAPKHVPNDARWGRFRLDYKTRLIGFIIPENLHGHFHADAKHFLDINTFYVVFLDANHKFYGSEDP